MARTIDNLGMDISTRYAQDKLLEDQTLIKESRTPVQTQIDVTLPYYTSEFELLFELGRRNATWADFFAPPQFYVQQKRLFSQQIIPALGSPDKSEAQSERIAAIGKVAKKREEEEKEGQKQSAYTAEEALEIREEEKEKKILLTLLERLRTFDQYLIDINSKRSQYQKG